MKKFRWLRTGLLFFLALSLVSNGFGQSRKTRLGVSENNRYLVYEATRDPFLLISGTAWALTQKLTREEVIQYLDIRQQQGFTAIQLLAHAHYYGPNQYDDLPFDNLNFTRPLVTPGDGFKDPEAYDWWDHLEWVMHQITKRDMFVLLLPTWRQQWAEKSNLRKDNAFIYGKFIGDRYKHMNDSIIWIMGGDMNIRNEDERLLHQRLASGIATGVSGTEDYSRVMMSYHTYGPSSTHTMWPEDEPFMDFNSVQSGHGLNRAIHLLEGCYQAHHKPTLDLEPYYENIKEEATADVIRTITYWSVFAGGFGTSYGHGNVWHFMPERGWDPPACYQGPNAVFAGQIKYLGNLLMSRPFLTRTPDQDIILSDDFAGTNDRIKACRSQDNTYMMVFVPHGRPFDVDLSRLNGDSTRWWWYNPREGTIHSKGVVENNKNALTCSAPTSGNRFEGHDWVLVLDDVAMGFAPPGVMVHKPDLIIESLTAEPGIPKPGEQTHFTMTVKNTGSLPIKKENKNSSMSLHINDSLVSIQQTVLDLDPGESVSIRFSGGWIPETEKRYQLKAAVDVTDLLDERSEINNTREEIILVSYPKPDLRFGTISWTPETPLMEEAVFFTVDVINSGNKEVPAGSLVDILIQFDNSETEITDSLLLSDALHGGDKVRFHHVGPKSFDRSGDQLITVSIDAENGIDELNETNNQKTVLVSVTEKMTFHHAKKVYFGVVQDPVNFLYDHNPATFPDILEPETENRFQIGQ